MPKEHKYTMVTEWKGNLGLGTSNYRSYSRNHQISAEGKHGLLSQMCPEHIDKLGFILRSVYD